MRSTSHRFQQKRKIKLVLLIQIFFSVIVENLWDLKKEQLKFFLSSFSVSSLVLCRRLPMKTHSNDEMARKNLLRLKVEIKIGISRKSSKFFPFLWLFQTT
jgi:hypothetical protein